MALWGKLIGLVLGGDPLGKALKSVDNYFDNETAKEQARLDLKAKWLEAQGAQFNSKSYKAFIIGMLAFGAPFWLHSSAVVLYSVFWHVRGPWPQAWNIAALPPPFDTWQGGIIMTFFGGMSAVALVAGGRK